MFEKVQRANYFKNIVFKLYETGRTEGIKAKKYYISMFEKVKGVYIHNGKIYACLNNKPEKIVDIDEVSHISSVLQDVLASILVGLLLKVEKEAIIDAIKNFKIKANRLELVATHNNITYIDDSKSTNIHSTLNGLSVVKDKVVLLLGGEDKNLDFSPIFEQYRERIDLIVTFGKTRKKIYKTGQKYGFENIKVNKTFVEAVRTACESAVENNIVLLSPACSSFDEFSSYAERGETFAKVVKKYIDAKS